jgi:two-component system phosphate regulon sensor histidine kinase PhoR/two-component system sensor histidine kinase VicK
MELKKQPKFASDFWPGFIKSSRIILILSQVLVFILIAVTLITTGIATINLWLILATISIFNTTILLLFVNKITKPTKKLLAAIIKVNDERPTLPVSSPNSEDDDETGLQDALQVIYKLASNQGSNKTNPSIDASGLINQALDLTICGFIAMDEKRQIIYANKSAPVNINTDNKKCLSLIFNENDGIDEWLDKCSNNSVHSEKIWTRIPDKLPNIEGRRFFDCIANYQRGGTPEVVISLIDRTSTYSVDEENLDFMSFAAHELRGPITVIRGYLDVLNDELVDVFKDDQSELFRRLIISASRLSGYINNILNTSKYDRRHLKMQLREGTAAAVYSAISDDMKMRAEAQHRLLAVSIPENIPTIAVDPTSMGEVFSNLIDNAIKYSNEGGAINVTARANDNFVEVEFEDHGIGMPESVISNLFQKFYRSHRSRETVAGTGIGLYICKAIVESHGGTISVRSEEGKGSTFTVSIPIYATVAEKLKANNNSNVGIINEGRGWIKNHSMYRG